MILKRHFQSCRQDILKQVLVDSSRPLKIAIEKIHCRVNYKHNERFKQKPIGIFEKLYLPEIKDYNPAKIISIRIKIQVKPGCFCQHF